MKKTVVLLVCIRLYPYVSRMYPYFTSVLVVCIRMYPYVPYVPYVTRMYSCGVLVLIINTCLDEMEEFKGRDIAFVSD